MASITKITLSGSSSTGRPVLVDQDSATGTTIHEGPATAADIDEVWLWATNVNTSTETLVLEWGAIADPADRMVTTINPNETVLISPGWLLQGNSTELLIKAFSTTANKINIIGYANRIDADG